MLALRQQETIIEAYENTVLGLLIKKGFFAKLLMTMRKDFNFPIPTAAVSVMSTGLTLHLNKEFFLSLTSSEREAILEHEILHVIHNHTQRFKQFKSEERGLANIACDIAINQYIPNIPKKISLRDPKTGEMVEGAPVSFEMLKQEIPSLLPRMNAEYYFHKMKEEGMGPSEAKKYELTDDHGEWDKSDLTPEQEERMVKGHVKAVLDGCSDQEKSCLDQSVIEEFYKSVNNWRAILRSFFANAEETFTESTRKKRNRRYGIIQPGFRNLPKLKIGIPVDTSGSVSDEWLTLMFSEIDHMWHENMIIYIIEADMKVRNVYEYKPGMKLTPSGRGGTAYQPAFDKCKELEVDACIYMGDMDCADDPEKPRMPVLWAIVGKQNPPVTWGRKIYLEK